MPKKIMLRFGLVIGILIAALSGIAFTRLFVSAQGPNLQYGDSLEGEIIDPEDEDVWRFEGQSGDVVSIRVTRERGDLVPLAVLTGPDDDLLVGLDWPQDGPSTVSFTVGLRRTGLQTLVVQGYEATTGAYRLDIELQEAANAVDTTGGVLNYGEMVTGEITDNNFRQFWTFRGAAGDIVDLVMTATGGDLDAYLALTGPSGNILATTDTGGMGRDAGLFSFRLPASGIYTVTARRAGQDFGAGGETAGTYDLELTLRQASDDAAEMTASELPLGTERRGLLTADAPLALYSFDASGVLSIALDLADPAQVGTVAVLSPNQGLLDVFSGTSPLRASITPPRDGQLRLEISALNIREDDPVEFSIRIDQLAVAQRLSRSLRYDVPYRISSTAVDQGQMWHFAGQPGDLVEILFTPFSPVPDGELVVSDPAGSVIVRHAARSTFAQPMILRAAGLYELAVPPEAALQGYGIQIKRRGISYLAFEQHGLVQQQGELAAGELAAGVLLPDRSDSWMLDVTTPRMWRFWLEETAGSTDTASQSLVLAVEAPSGETLAVATLNSLSRAGTTQVNLPHPGRYRVVVFNAAGSVEKSYSLRGQPVEGGVLSAGMPEKGVLPGSDVWELDVMQGSLLNVQVDVHVGDSTPVVYVTGPGGELVASSRQGDQPDRVQLLGVSVPTGGRHQIWVSQPGSSQRTVYQIRANTGRPFDDADTLVTTATPLPEVFVAPSPDKPTSTIQTVQITEQVTPSIPVDGTLFTAAPRAELNALVRGEVETGTQYQAWAFSPDTVGRMLNFSVTALDDTSGPDLIILDQEGQVLAEKFTRDAYTTDLHYRFSSTKTFYLVVRLNQGGRYTLWIDTLSSIDESVPEVTAGRVIGYGDTVTGELLAQDGAGQAFLFYGRRGDVIITRAARIGGQAALRVTLQDPDGNDVTAAGGSIVSDLLNAELPLSGIYRLYVTRQGDQPVQPVQFALHLSLAQAQNAMQQGGGPLHNAQTAQLPALDASHRWLFDGRAGEKVTVRVEMLTPDPPNELRLELADTAGNVFLQKQAHLGQGSIQLTDVILPRSGVYLAIVGGGQFQYQIHLERDANHPGGEEGALRYGVTDGKVLTQENYLDVWTFAGSRGDLVSVQTHAVRGDDIFVAFQLRANDGQILATAVDDGAGRGARVDGIFLPADGHYSLIVGNLDGEFNGNTAYEITVHLRNTSARSMGTTMAYEQTVHGSFFLHDPADIWLFEGQQGDQVTATLVGEGVLVSLVSTHWHIADTTGTPEVLASAYASERAAQLDRFPLPASGPYALMVQDIDAAGGSYELVLSAEQPAAVPTQPAKADQTLTGAVGEGQHIDGWTFAGEKGGLVTISVVPDSRSLLSAEAMLVSSTGTVLVRSEIDATAEAEIAPFLLPYDDTFVIYVTRTLGQDGKSWGRYDLTFKQEPSPEQTLRPITYNPVPELSTLDSQFPAERWGFEGQQGSVVRVAAEATSGDLDTVLRVYDPQGHLLASSDDVQGQDAVAHVVLPEDGVYEVEVSRYGGPAGSTTGNYGLSVESIYRFEPIQMQYLLGYGDRVNGTISSQERSDFWAFSSQEGDVIQAHLQFPLDDVPLLLYLRDPAGNLLAEGVREFGDASIATFTVPTNGLYTFEVRRPGDASSVYSIYALELDLVKAADSTSSQGGVLPIDRAVVGEFAQAPSSHIWLVQGNAGQQISLSLTGLEGVLSGQFVLFGPGGTVQFTTPVHPDLVGTAFPGKITLPVDGIYTVVFASDHSMPGTRYRLLAQDVSLADPPQRSLGPLEDGYGVLNDLAVREEWTFEANAGEAVFLHASVVEGDLSPTLTLWGPDRSPLVSSGAATSGIATIRHVVPESGTYYVSVSRHTGELGNTAGSYRLMLRQHSMSRRALFASDINYGDDVHGIITEGTPETYAFSGTAGDVVSVSVRAVDGTTTAPELRLEDESGTELEVPVTVTGSEASITGFELPQHGRYILVLQGGDAVRFALTAIRHDPARAGTTPRELILGQPRNHAVTEPNQATPWTFSAEMGDVFTFETDTTGSGLRATMLLYGPEGFIAGAAQTAASQTVTLGPVRLPADGEYYLSVGAWLNASRGRYTVRRDRAAEGVSGSAGGYIYPDSSPVFGGLNPQDATDVWAFKGRSGEVIAIRAAQLIGNELLSLKLRGPDGVSIVTGTSSDTYRGVEIEAVMLPVDGRYEIVVSGSPTSELAIEYNLTLLRLQGPVVASIQTAAGIEYGTSGAGLLTSAQPYQAWVFYGRAGERVRGSITPDDDEFIPALYFVGPDGEIIYADANIMGGAAAQLSDFTLVQTGFYGLVAGYSSAQSEVVDAPYTANLERLAAGAVSQGMLTDSGAGKLTAPAAVHDWQVSPQYSGHYVVEVVSLILSASLDVFILDADGDTIGTAMAAGNGNKMTMAYLQADGSYHAVVSGSPLASHGQYAVRIIPAALITNGGSLTAGQPDVGRIDATHLGDEWYVQGQAGQQWQLKVAVLTGDLELSVVVLDEDGNQVAAQSATDVVDIQTSLPRDGRYVIQVTRADGAVGSSSGDYSIQLQAAS
jgi:hypothetical protein